MPRYALLVAWHGAAFAGWWRQAGSRTVAGELDAAFARLGEAGAAPVGASRTDAGVHARGQLAHVDLRRSWEPRRLLALLDRQLPADLAVRAAAAVPDTWHAVHGVRRKTYRYRLDVDAVRDPFLAGLAWRPPWPLDPQRLAAAAALLPGRRDWAAFVRRGDHREDTVRTITACRWRRCAGGLACDLAAEAFVHHLARSLVGGMLLVGRGAATLDDWRAALAGTVNACSRQCVPARGLCLLRIVHRQPPAWTAASAAHGLRRS